MRNYLFKQLLLKQDGSRVIPYKIIETSITELDPDTYKPRVVKKNEIYMFHITGTINTEQPVIVIADITDEDSFLDSFDILPDGDASDDFMDSFDIVSERIEIVAKEMDDLSDLSTCLFKNYNKAKKSTKKHLTIDSDDATLIEISANRNMGEKQYLMIKEALNDVIMENLDNEDDDDKIEKKISESIHNLIIKNLGSKYVVSKCFINANKILEIVKEARKSIDEQEN